MPRSGAEARARLEAAAIQLVGERGFDTVTAAQIAERAGVTERTFFRHFPDKREVLFNGERLLTAWVSEAIGGIPTATGPWQTVREVALAIAPALEGNRALGDPLARLVEAHPALAERAAAKEAAVVRLLAGALVDRGTDVDTAAAVAGAGWAALARAVTAWRADPDAGLAAQVERLFGLLERSVREAR